MADSSQDLEAKKPGAAEKDSASRNFTFLMLVMLNLANPDESVIDEPAINQIAKAFGIDIDMFKSTVADLRNGDTDIYQSVEHLYHSISDKSAIDFKRADDALDRFHTLQNIDVSGNAKFIDTMEVILKIEGGWNPNEPDGAVAKYGINSKANPDIDVANLTQSNALSLYKDRYWDKVTGIDKMDPAAALAVMDLAVNSGAGRANQFLKALESEGKANLSSGTVDVAALMEKRDDFLDGLVAKNPAKYARYEDGWDNRLDIISNAIKAMPRQDLSGQYDAALAATDPLQIDPMQPKPLPFDGIGVDQIAMNPNLDTPLTDQGHGIKLTGFSIGK